MQVHIKIKRNWMVVILLLLTPFVQNCSKFTASTASSHGTSTSCIQPSARATAGTSVYQQKCASCHSAITSSSIANRSFAQIGRALSSIPQMNGLSANLSEDDIYSIEAALSTTNSSVQKCAELKTSNFTRSSTEVMQSRVTMLFPSANVALMADPTKPLGQALGLPDFLTSFSVIQPNSASAQAAFQKYVIADLCKVSSTDSTIFSAQDVLMAGEVLPSDPDTAMAFKAARNVWLSPYAADSPEVKVLVNLIGKMKTDGASAAEVQQAVCLATMSSPQFWMGNSGKYEPIKRIALEIGRRRPTFAEFSSFNTGALTLASYVQKIQREPNYIETVKTWHRNWLGPKNFARLSGRRRGVKYWWGSNGATLQAGQEFVAVDSTGSLDPTIPIIKHYAQNDTELSDSDSCQPFPQTFNPTTQRIQWEQRVGGQWYIVGGSKLVSGAWQNFGGSVPVNGTPVATTLADITKASAVVNKVSFHYQSGALAGLADFAATERRVRRFTLPDDVNPNAAAPASEQNGYSLVKLWWSGQPVYMCNSLYRFIQTCAYRPTVKGLINDSKNWTGNTGQIVANMGGSSYIGVDSLAHPNILADMRCSINMTGSGVSFSTSGTLNSTIINGEISFFGDGVRTIANPANYSALTQEKAAAASIDQDMFEEPMNLVADIVSNGLDYRSLLTADWTYARGPLELMYRLQGHYLASYPPGFSRVPGGADYMNSVRVYPMSFSRLPREFFKNSLGGQVAANTSHIFDDPAAAVSAIDDPNLPNLAPRPVSGVLTQTSFYGEAVPKLRSISAKILRTFTCGEVNTYVPTAAQRPLHVKYIPIAEKSGSQHVDQSGACFACHVNMDPLASALSLGFMLKTNPFKNNIPINNGSEWLYAFGEIAPYATDDAGGGFRYGIRGNLDLPSRGALFGHEIAGVRDVGRVLSQSDLFAQCAVMQAFNGVFGRPANFPEDQPMIDAVKKNWINSGYNYNKLIELLVTSPQFQVRN